jgi:hypothetical protein
MLNTEFAVSRFDVNTFSSKDGKDDIGFAGKIKLNYDQPLSDAKEPLVLKMNTSYERVQANFRPIERLRPVEFTREWGLPIFMQQEEEQIIEVSAELSKKVNHTIRNGFQHYQRGLLFKGWRYQLQHNLVHGRWNWTGSLNYSSMDSGSNKGFFLRPQLQLKRQIKLLGNAEIGGVYYLEHNEIDNTLADTVVRTSFAWDTWTLFLRSSGQPNRWGFDFFTRRDKLPFAGKLLETDRSMNYNFFLELLENENRQLKFNATYRQLNVSNPNITNQKSDRSLLGRTEYIFNEWSGGVSGNILYETGSGQEQRRDFSFLEVAAGQGEYTWNDYNGDGVAQVNEFEIAAFRDQARYIRVFTPTLDFIRANYNQFNYTIDVQPALWMNRDQRNGFAKVFSRLSVRCSWQLFKKQISDRDFELNPFSKISNDTSLITLNNFISNTLFFNRTSTKWGFEVTHVRNSGRSIATYGAETRINEEFINRLRWNISRKISTTLNLKYGLNELQTPKFDNRNYLIRLWSAEPAFSLQNGTQSRIVISYKFDSKDNQAGSGESVRIHSLISEMRYNVLSSSTVNLRIQMSDISYKNGSVNSPVAFIMLDALLPGQNFIWNLDITKRLANNMEITIQYDGRKPGTGNVIHTGRAGVRALF